MDRAELRAVLRATGCAEEVEGIVFLHDPNPTAAQRAALAALKKRGAGPAAAPSQGWLCVATGGSSGGMKLARHDEGTLGAAVAGLRAHFGLARINAVDVLPPYHVSGLLARVRAAATGGEHLPWDWKRLAAGERPRLRACPEGWVISLVPTQLQRLLQERAAIDWLREFRVIFLGGGPLWAELAEAAAEARLPLAPSYGMTETAAMVTALRPEEFLAGERSCGSALPHARIAITAEGGVCVAGESVFRGYWPEGREEREFVTEDLGELDARGRLRILGRRDAVIISGGKKVHPAEVEAALRRSGQFAEVAVIGVPDPEWGEMVVACYPAGGGWHGDSARGGADLAPFQRPKRFLAIDPWPGNAQGKVNRAQLLAQARELIARKR